MKKLTILGSTGSVGEQSLDICDNLGAGIVALAAGRDVAKLEAQARRYRPEAVAIADEDQYNALRLALRDTDVKILAGRDGVCEAAAMSGADVVINAIMGFAGLRPTIAALEAGHDVALANKEALIAGGGLVTKTAQDNGARILPVDSEHSAIFQCMQAGERQDVRGIVLTASGGPFAGKTRQELADVKVADALTHPNWSMGAKITIDCASLMNKGLEFIEAMWLFDLTPEQIEIVVHRQSIIHSAVEFMDGSIIAQLSVPDMRGAIQYAITYPRHQSFSGKRLSLTDVGKLTFEKPDMAVFGCLGICIEAAKKGGSAPCVINAANEAAVDLFINGRIGFMDIERLVAAAHEAIVLPPPRSLRDIETADRLAREYVQSQYDHGKGTVVS